MIVTKRNSLRIAAVTAVSAVCVALAGTAMAAPPQQTAHAAPSAHEAAKPTISAQPSVSSVRAWELFRVTGKTTGLKAGSKVTLQQNQHGKWVSLPASVSIARTGTYSLRVKLGLKGRNDLRMVSASTVSAVFHVTVR